MKKVLFLAYYFPPMGGGGVQRVAKFCKYLPACGYTPSVLTAQTGSAAAVTDRTLMQEVQSVRRYEIAAPQGRSLAEKLAATFPGRCFNLHQRQSVRAAVTAGRRAIEAEAPDLLCVSVSPFYMAAAAAALSRRYRIPWVLDMRDPWALDPINYYATRLHYLSDRRAMKQACRAAQAVIMNTPNSLAAVRAQFHDLDPEKFSCITNGWDAADFQAALPAPAAPAPARPMVIVHTGVFHMKSVLKLNRPAGQGLRDWPRAIKNAVKYSVGQSDFLTRTPYYLFEAMARLRADGRLAPDDIRVVMVGDCQTEDHDLVRRFGLEAMVEFRGYLDHDRSVEALRQADVLFLPLHEPQHGLPPLIVPGKTYEYLAAEKPILAPVPDGDVRSMVRQAGLGWVCEPTEAAQIAETLMTLLARHRTPAGLSVSANRPFIRQFERTVLTEQLAGLFDRVLEDGLPS